MGNGHQIANSSNCPFARCYFLRRLQNKLNEKMSEKFRIRILMGILVTMMFTYGIDIGILNGIDGGEQIYGVQDLAGENGLCLKVFEKSSS